MQGLLALQNGCLNVRGLERHVTDLVAASVTAAGDAGLLGGVDDGKPRSTPVSVTFLQTDVVEVQVDCSQSPAARFSQPGAEGAALFSGRSLVSVRDFDPTSAGRSSVGLFDRDATSSAAPSHRNMSVRGRLITMLSEAGPDVAPQGPRAGVREERDGVLDLAGGVVVVEMPFPQYLDGPDGQDTEGSCVSMLQSGWANAYGDMSPMSSSLGDARVRRVGGWVDGWARWCGFKGKRGGFVGFFP
jgi:hypothetical protein